MCKIFGVTNMTKIPAEKLEEVLNFAKDIVTEGNRDGFGYALSYKSTVFAEKFVNPSDFRGIGLAALDERINNRFFNYDASVTYGDLETTKSSMPVAMIAHGRTSTNHKGWPEYSHPFVNEKTGDAFIHNGVVDVPRQKDNPYYDKMETKNDSEYLANVFWDKGPAGLAEISGYFACMNLKRNGEIVIFRDSMGQLYGCYSQTLQGYVFGTMKSMVERFCTKFDLKHSVIVPVQDDMLAVIKRDKITKMETIKKSVKKKNLSALEKNAFKDYRSNTPTVYSGKTSANSTATSSSVGLVKSNSSKEDLKEIQKVTSSFEGRHLTEIIGDDEDYLLSQGNACDLPLLDTDDLYSLTDERIDELTEAGRIKDGATRYFWEPRENGGPSVAAKYIFDSTEQDWFRV